MRAPGLRHLGHDPTLARRRRVAAVGRVRVEGNRDFIGAPLNATISAA
jgi:hypothetical protein